jgi:hypothetical protein
MRICVEALERWKQVLGLGFWVLVKEITKNSVLISVISGHY